MARRPKAPLVPEVEPEGLSPQQKQVWQLARQGFTVEEIATKLNTSNKMVRLQLHRMRIMISKGVNKNPEQVSYALDPAQKYQILSSDISFQEKVEILSRTGHMSSRAIAEHIGSTPGSVRVMRTRMRYSARKGRVTKREASQEEIAVLANKVRPEPEIVASLTYEAYMQDDPLSPQAMAVRRLLAAVGGGGPQIRQIAFRDRARKLKKLLAERKGLLKAFGRSAAVLVQDIIANEFVWIDDTTFRPRRKMSWEILRAAVRDRYKLVAEGRVVIRPTGRVEEQMPVYRMTLLEEPAAAVRQTPDGYRVARAEQIDRAGRPIARGSLKELRQATAVLSTPGGAMEVPCTAVVVRRRGRRGGTWEINDLGLLQPGDEVVAHDDGRLETKAKDINIVVLTQTDTAYLAAWCIVGEPCWIEMDGWDKPARWRCDLPSVRSVAVIDLASLDWDRGAVEDAAEVVKVRPYREGTEVKYKVVVGAERVAEAAARGAKEIPVVIEQPLANQN